MYRLNVAAEQIEECIRQGMFALTFKPQISAGEILLLQLKKSDWEAQGSVGGRIEHALVFQRAEQDQEGLLSRKHWPNAGKIWPWIIYSSAVLDIEPFSLEELPLHRESRYQAQANPVRIDPEDEAIITPFIKWFSISPLEPLAKTNDKVPFAIAETAKTIEEISVGHALSEVKKLYPTAKIEVMHHNNPGFDILVTEQNRVTRYIEVKGTQSDRPVFHMTETERRFSKNNSSLYSLLVVWNLNLSDGTYKISRYDGEISIGEILRPYRYLGELKV